MIGSELLRDVVGGILQGAVAKLRADDEVNLEAHRAEWLRACYESLGANAGDVLTAPMDGDPYRVLLHGHDGERLTSANTQLDQPVEAALRAVEALQRVEADASSPIDPLNDPRMDGDTWITPTDEECNAWPFWEFDCGQGDACTSDQEHFRTAEDARAARVNHPWMLWRPLRLPEMNARGEVQWSDMTSDHFDRVIEWQWQVKGGLWHTMPGPAHIDAVEKGETWRPSIFARLDDETESEPDGASRDELQRQIDATMAHVEGFTPNTSEGAPLDEFEADAIGTLTRLLWTSTRNENVGRRDRIDAAMAHLAPHFDGETDRVDVAAEKAVAALTSKIDEARAHAAASAAKLANSQQVADKLSQLYDALDVDSLDAAIRAAQALRSE